MNLGAIAMHRRDAAIAVASALVKHWPDIEPSLGYEVPAAANALRPLLRVFERVDEEFYHASSTSEGVDPS